MVWSKEDFAREVRRQLIEMESIRRKVSADSPSAADGGDKSAAKKKTTASNKSKSGKGQEATSGPSRTQREIMDSLDRLEESQYFILRKLEAYAEQLGLASDAKSTDSSENAGKVESTAKNSLPESIQAYIQLLLSEPSLLHQLSAQSGEVSSDDDDLPQASAVIFLGISGKKATRLGGLGGGLGDFGGMGGFGGMGDQGGPFPPYSLN